MDHAFRLLAHAPRVAALVAVISLVPAPSIAARRPWVIAPAAPISPAPEAPQSVAGPSLWHVVESAVDPAQRPAFLLRGSRSIWCGAYSPCWAIPVGYPNLKWEILFLDTGSHDDAYTLNVTMNASAELFYDHLYLIGGGGGATDPIGNSASLIATIISEGSSGNSRLLVDWTGSIHADTPEAMSMDTTLGPVTIFGDVGQPDSLTASITIASEHRALYFVFRSDELYSPEDGLWPFGSGVLLDDLVTSDNGAIYTDAPPAGGTDSFGGSVLVGTAGAPIVSSRKVFTGSQPPSITVPADLTRTEGEGISMTATAADPDAFDIIGMSVCGYPTGLTLTFGSNPASETLSGNLPCGAAAGSPYSILWSATSLFTDVSGTTVLTVLPNPHAPVVTAPATITRAVGSIVFFRVLASDPDADAITTLTADLTDLPTGATFSPEPGNRAGSFTWAPLSGHEGSYSIGFVASNALQGCAGTRINIVPGGATGVELDAHSPAAPSLDQNRPNPFNPQTSIRVNLPREARITLDVFDVHGRHVIALLDRVLPAGSRDVFWDGRDARGRDLPSGIYFYRMGGEGVSLTRRMVLLR